MEIIISALIGAFSAIGVALINSSRSNIKKDKLIKELVKDLKIETENIYIIDKKTKKDNVFKYKSEGSNVEKHLIILK